MAENLKLRPYQEAAIHRFLEGAEQGHKRQIIQKPTGTGKTITGLALSQRIGRTLWLAHREELIDQPIETLKTIWPERRYGVVKRSRDERLAEDIVFASVQSTIGRLDKPWGDFALLVVDEAHHAAAKTYLRIIDNFTAKNPKMLVAGLTATPTRSDRKNLSLAGFSAFAYRMSINEAIRHGYLAPFKGERVVRPLEGEAHRKWRLQRGFPRRGARESTRCRAHFESSRRKVRRQEDDRLHRDR
jgi:ATP-dependent helicase IRC3